MKQGALRIALACSLAFTFMLAGCATEQNPVARSLTSFRILAKLIQGPPEPKLNPAYRYLRVTSNGHTAFVALGYIDGKGKERTEVWYSADKAVLRLRHGRVAGISGAIAEWRRVSQPDAPTWEQALHASGTLRWQRTRDVMPGYHFGIVDAMRLKRIAPPDDTALKGIDPGSLVWFEERAVGSGLPPALYAVKPHHGQATVIFGKQCISDRLCLSWQRWPVGR